MAKQKQRGHGEGTIYQRKDGRWAASISLGPGRKRRTFYGKTRKEVQEKLNEALHEQKRGTLTTGTKQTVKAYLEEWLEHVHKSTIRISSYAKYRSMLDRYILPTLGHIQLQKLTPQQVQALYAEHLQKGLSASVVLSMHGLLHKALDNAVRWGLIARNVCDIVSPPRYRRQEIHALTKEQAQKLMAAAQGHRLEAMITLGLATGMRRGELLALRWQDINLNDKSLQVCRTVGYVPGYGMVESEPKTSRSRRKIVLPSFVIEVIKEHRIRQQEAQLKAGSTWQENDLVFPNLHGTLLDTSNLRQMFQKLLKDAGLPHMRFHDLRHSAATILLTMGAHPKVVQELLGHSQISMTMDIYSHVLPSMHRETMDDLDDFFR